MTYDLTRRSLFTGAVGVAGAGLLVQPADAVLTDVRAALDASIRATCRNTKTGVAVLDHRTGAHYGYASTWANNTASIVKVILVAGVLRRARRLGRALTTTEKTATRNAIIYSDNNAATTCYRIIGGDSGILATAKAFGMWDTLPWSGYGWGRTWTTALDQRKLISALYLGSSALHSTDRAYLWGLMGKTDPAQSWGVGIVRSSTVTVNMKNGWVPLSNDNLWRVNTVGHVKGNGRNYTLTVLCGSVPTLSTGITRVNTISRNVYSILGKGVLMGAVGSALA
ncbi:MAG TPA: serine hydrolase [Propionibacteriaceae bacterium]|nr:serine hydrolase [Propionibacteriaceae bacterium]